MTDQAAALREAMAQTQSAPPPLPSVPPPAVTVGELPKGMGLKRARTLAIASGKGGVGKSTLTTNLAVRLAEMGRRVVVLDADLGTANVDVMCGMSPAMNVSHVVSGRASMREVMVTGPGGFRLVPGASGLSEIAGMDTARRARLLEEMRPIEAEADVVLMDCGAGVGPNVLGFALAADSVLVVATPEPTAITDAYALIKSLRRRSSAVDIRLIVNEARNEAEARAVYERLADVCRRFLGMSLPFAGSVLLDPQVGAAVRQRKPVVQVSPKSAAAQGVTRLAHRLDRHAAEPRRGGLLQRMATWLQR